MLTVLLLELASTVYSNEIHELSDKPIISMYDNTNDKVGSSLMNKKNGPKLT